MTFAYTQTHTTFSWQHSSINRYSLRTCYGNFSVFLLCDFHHLILAGKLCVIFPGNMFEYFSDFPPNFPRFLAQNLLLLLFWKWISRISELFENPGNFPIIIVVLLDFFENCKFAKQFRVIHFLLLRMQFATF